MKGQKKRLNEIAAELVLLAPKDGEKSTEWWKAKEMWANLAVHTHRVTPIQIDNLKEQVEKARKEYIHRNPHPAIFS